MAKGKNTVSVVTDLARPVADRMGLELWDVRFEKEGATWYLRVFIDKEGGVTIDDCEQFSRAVDALLDEADPIEQSYVFEVGSPGIERELRRGWHFQRYLGAAVSLRLIRPVNGQKDFVGRLAGYEDGAVTLQLDGGGELKAAPGEAAYVKLYEDFDDMGGPDE